MDKIRIGIVGYGNIGKGVEKAIARNEDMELAAVFTRRDPASVKIETKTAAVKSMDDMKAMKGEVDVMILCGGSATDLPVMGPQIAADFNTIDSFDTHARIPEYFANVDQAAKAGENVSIISVGWDPGMFSLNRLYAESILVQGSTYTFWGRGVSQGHSDAIRRIEGVKNAIQYTVPIEDAVNRVRSGSEPSLTTREKHLRECYVVPEEGADLKAIEEAIKTMPNYFDEYDTTVTFITEEELKENHSQMPHGGFVIRTGETGTEGSRHVIEYSLKLDSNPEFTASVLVAYARAAYRLSKKGESGARTVFDIAPALLSMKTPEVQRADLLGSLTPMPIMTTSSLTGTGKHSFLPWKKEASEPLSTSALPTSPAAGY